MEPRISRLPFSASWISEIFSSDNESIARALQVTLDSSSAAPHHSSNPPPDLTFSSVFDPPQTPSASVISDPTLKRRSAAPILGKVAKRKSRASKRTQTTFISADPAHFRQMVQQVTGVRLGGQEALPVMKPEVQRLHASPLLLSGRDPVGDSLNLQASSSSEMLSYPEAVSADGGSAAAFDFEGFGVFPTLESWKVM